MKDLVLCSYLAIQLFHEFIKKTKKNKNRQDFGSSRMQGFFIILSFTAFCRNTIGSFL